MENEPKADEPQQPEPVQPTELSAMQRGATWSLDLWAIEQTQRIDDESRRNPLYRGQGAC